MAATEVIRVRVRPEDKSRLTRLYAARGTTLSQAVRTFLLSELDAEADALEMLDRIADSAERKIEASGLSSPSVDDIVAYVEAVRDERTADALVAQ